MATGDLFMFIEIKDRRDGKKVMGDLHTTTTNPPFINELVTDANDKYVYLLETYRIPSIYRARM